MYDPAYPPQNAEIESAPLRGQFTGLKDFIDAIVSLTGATVDSVNTINFNEPATATANLVGSVLHFSFDIPRGGVGAPGAEGPPFAQALVDAVNTLDPGQPATVSLYFDGSNVRFIFGIPRGNDGNQGQAGNNGSDGGPGPQGAQGPPFAQAVVDGVTTLDPGQPATVSVYFDGSNVRFTLGIPRGEIGFTGPQGIQGPPGEVTAADLSSAIANTMNQSSANTNAVPTMDVPFMNDPPTLADMETMRAAYNALVLGLRRP